MFLSWSQGHQTAVWASEGGSSGIGSANEKALRSRLAELSKEIDAKRTAKTAIEAQIASLADETKR
jgi:hypothetical protein